MLALVMVLREECRVRRSSSGGRIRDLGFVLPWLWLCEFEKGGVDSVLSAS